MALTSVFIMLSTLCDEYVDRCCCCRTSLLSMPVLWRLLSFLLYFCFYLFTVFPTICILCADVSMKACETSWFSKLNQWMNEFVRMSRHRFLVYLMRLLHYYIITNGIDSNFCCTILVDGFFGVLLFWSDSSISV